MLGTRRLEERDSHDAAPGRARAAMLVAGLNLKQGVREGSKGQNKARVAVAKKGGAATRCEQGDAARWRRRGGSVWQYRGPVFRALLGIDDANETHDSNGIQVTRPDSFSKRSKCTQAQGAAGKGGAVTAGAAGNA